MPDLTVIEGGGQGQPSPDYEAERAEYAFQTHIIELLRALSRGDDYGSRVGQALLDFWRSAGSTEAPFQPMVQSVISELHKEALLDDQFSESVADCRKRIVQAALRVAAEAMATDGAARARLSKRVESLDDAVEAYLLGRESRSRAHVWSYTERLVTEHLGRWRPPPQPKAALSRKAARKKPKTIDL